MDPLKVLAIGPERVEIAFADPAPIHEFDADFECRLGCSDEVVLTGDQRRNVEEIRTDVLEALADEIRHMLDEGVVGAAADVDTCLILGAGWPFFLGGISKHLDGTGISERVVGSPLAGYGRVPA